MLQLSWEALIWCAQGECIVHDGPYRTLSPPIEVRTNFLQHWFTNSRPAKWPGQ